jgi:hypothetical protein
MKEWPRRLVPEMGVSPSYFALGVPGEVRNQVGTTVRVLLTRLWLVPSNRRFSPPQQHRLWPHDASPREVTLRPNRISTVAGDSRALLDDRQRGPRVCQPSDKGHEDSLVPKITTPHKNPPSLLALGCGLIN